MKLEEDKIAESKKQSEYEREQDAKDCAYRWEEDAKDRANQREIAKAQTNAFLALAELLKKNSSKDGP